MIYLHNPRNRHRRGKGFALAVALILAVIAFNFFVPNFMVPALLRSGAPLWRVRNTISGVVSSLGAYMSSKGALERDRERLMRIAEDLRVEVGRREAIVQEHESLLRELGRDDPRDFIHAYILRKPGVAPFDVVILDAGVRQGIKVGARVWVGGSVIGEINESKSAVSTAELYSSPGRETEVIINGVNIETIARGRGGGNFEATLPRDISVSRGALLEIPGKKGVLAEVIEIEIDDTSAEQVLFARTLTNIQMRSWVLVERERPILQ